MAPERKLVFTNGCFDLLHRGHVDLLQRARELGSALVVGLNSDHSVRQLKGPERPYWSEEDRAAMLRALRCVDDVMIFEEATPERLIDQLRPEVLVKGGDWPVHKIVGADKVFAWGGEVHSLPLLSGYSTSSLADHIQRSSRQGPWLRAS